MNKKEDKDKSLSQLPTFIPWAEAMLIYSLGFDLSEGNSLILLQHSSLGQNVSTVGGAFEQHL